MHSLRKKLAFGATALTLALTASLGAATPTHAIVGGGWAEIQNSPYMVALVQKGISNFDGQFCGGAVIATHWVLTAAHCVKGIAPSSFRVGTGSSSLDAMTDFRAVDEVDVNPNYDRWMHTFDVALVHVTRAFPTSSRIAINRDGASPAPGSALLTVGWGAATNDGLRFPDHLRGALLLNLQSPNGSCQQWGTTFIVEHHICAGVPDGTVASCGGDSGSPLVTVQNGRLVLAGVTSFGPAYYCARKGLPPVYARVSRYQNFIANHVPGLI